MLDNDHTSQPATRYLMLDYLLNWPAYNSTVNCMGCLYLCINLRVRYMRDRLDFEIEDLLLLAAFEEQLFPALQSPCFAISVLMLL